MDRSTAAETGRLDWLTDPRVFAVGRLPAHSDHAFAAADGTALFSLCLDGRWSFAAFASPAQVDWGFLSPDFARTAAEITVPGHLQLQGFGRPQYVNTMYPWDGREQLSAPAVPQKDNLTGCYGLRFALPENCAGGGRLRLCFEGAESCLYAWLNGRFLGYAEDSFTPSEFDITDAAVAGNNWLAVMVVRWCSGSWLEDQDFWRFSGLFRSVRLFAVPPLHLRDLCARAEVASDLSFAVLELTAEAEGAVSGGFAAEFALFDPDGQPVGASVRAAGENGRVRAVLPVVSPRLWSAERPELYTVRALLLDAQGRPAERAQTTVGLRRFELRGGIMTLNGRRLVLRGVNRHEFSCDRGRAITAAEIESDLRLLKQNNFNAVRTSHYPNQSLFYTLCDQLGLYVIDETNLETHGSWMVMGALKNDGRDAIPGDSDLWRGAVLDRGASMLERDKNHPCILMWSCGNESCGGSVLHELANWLRSRDNTRLIHYEGIFWDRRWPDTSDVESRMYAKPEEIERYLAARPQKPYLSCEYAHAMGNSLGNLELYTRLEDQYPQYQGGFIWDFLDQELWVTDADGKRWLAGGSFDGAFDKPTDGRFCANGLLFADRTPSPKLREAKFLYSPLRLRCAADGIAIENRNLFVDTSALRFEWSLLQDGVCARSGSFAAAVPAGQTQTVPLPAGAAALPPAGGEWVLECRAVLAAPCSWAPAGHEITFAQTVLRAAPAPALPNRRAALVCGDCNTGADLGRSFAQIWHPSGQLVSWRAEFGELLCSGVQAEFWRAPTENDLGNRAPARWGQWKLASLYQFCTEVRRSAADGTVTTVLALPGEPQRRCELTCTFCAQDTLGLRVRMERPQGDLPCFGLSFAMPARFDRLQWYGNTAAEAGCDRHSSCRLGRGEGRVQEQLTPYLKPQECAGKTDLRALYILDADGHGLRVTAPHAFAASVLPWTAHELENAGHQRELPPPTRTVVRLLQGQCGVGGDDSWGAPVHREYLFPGTQELDFTVFLTLLDGRA